MMAGIENLQRYEYDDLASFSTVVVLRATYHGQRIGVRMSVAQEVKENPGLMEIAQQILEEELEYEAVKLRRPRPDPEMDALFEEYRRQRDEAWDNITENAKPKPVGFSWVKEGF